MGKCVYFPKIGPYISGIHLEREQCHVSKTKTPCKQMGRLGKGCRVGIPLHSQALCVRKTRFHHTSPTLLLLVLHHCFGLDRTSVNAYLFTGVLEVWEARKPWICSLLSPEELLGNKDLDYSCVWDMIIQQEEENIMRLR